MGAQRRWAVVASTTGGRGGLGVQRQASATGVGARRWADAAAWEHDR
jgi:hypothetical protein